MIFILLTIALSLLTLYIFIIMKIEEKMALCYHEYENLGIKIHDLYRSPVQKYKCKKCGHETYGPISGVNEDDDV